MWRKKCAYRKLKGNTMSQTAPSQYRIRKNLVTGLTLIFIGSVFLLDRLEILDIRQIWRLNVHQFWHLWPVFIALIGINKILSAEKNSQFVHGCFQVVLAFWLYASLEHLWGWSFSNSWPVLLIGYGLSHILGGFIKNQK